jgi:hypothetical protein
MKALSFCLLSRVISLRLLSQMSQEELLGGCNSSKS